MSTFLLSLLFLFAAPAQQTPTPNPADLCTIQGVVVKAGTGEPLRKASVEARSATSGHSQANFAVTDAMGRFELKGLDPGRYHLLARHNGFVIQQYGQRAPDGPDEILTLSSGQKVSDITFQLIPAAAISGHVYDEDGEAVSGAQVTAMSYVYADGQRQLRDSRSGQSDDRGEFRIFGLSPGQYLVRATLQTNQFDNPRTNQGYAPIYYPGVSDVGRAAPIAVRGGDEFSGVDLSLQPVRALTIKGHVFTAGCGAPTQGMMLALQSASASANPQFLPYDPNSQGAIEFHNVSPGSYYLSAMVFNEGKPCLGRQALEVTDTNIDGVTLTVTPGAEIKGHLHIEGSLDPNRGSFSVSMLPKGAPPILGPLPYDTVKPDGDFLLKNAYDGDYEINVANLPENYFVKSARLDGVDVLNAGVTVDTKQAPGLLDIVVSPNGASVDGTISKDQQPFQGATVVLVPAPPHRGEGRLFKSTTTDQNGHFILQGIPPGDYKVFAWEKIEHGAYTIPEVLAPYESLGESVHITEGARNTVQLDLIPIKDSNP